VQADANNACLRRGSGDLGFREMSMRLHSRVWGLPYACRESGSAQKVEVNMSEENLTVVDAQKRIDLFASK
jgi:hypothetical protein